MRKVLNFIRLVSGKQAHDDLAWLEAELRERYGDEDE